MSEVAFEVPAEKVHELRRLHVELLNLYEKKHKIHMRHEDLWRSARVGSVLLPFVSAVVLKKTGHEYLSANHKVLAEYGSFLGAVAVFAGSNAMRKLSFKKAYETGLQAVPIVEEMGMTTPAWLEKALEPDKDVDPYVPARAS